MRALIAELRAKPVIERCATIGLLIGALTGAIGGLTVGLLTYAPTAWFAMFEVGIPAAVLCTVIGLVIGSVTIGCRAVTRSFDRRAT